VTHNGHYVTSHQDLIRDQFTKQSVPFSSAPAIRNEEALKLLLELTNASSLDTVLDVACGPGIVACAFAEVVAHTTGIDLTPAMIERARALQAERRLANVAWRVGDIVPLPYADGSFSIVTSRYAFHHLQDPQAAMNEMHRVCKDGGQIVLIDQVASANPKQADALNRMERLRDPSHVRALTLAELHGLFASVGLRNRRMASYTLDAELDMLLKGSFPNEGDAETVRRMVIDSLDGDGMNVGTRRVDGRIWISYPIAVLIAGKRPA
jgi:SAM-dependent methyltransferase